MKSTSIKILASLFILIGAIMIGLNYVAPRVLLKMSRQKGNSSAADFGMRFDKLVAVSEDSLDLHGDIIYPFTNNVGEIIPNHSLIVIHPVGHNSIMVYPRLKPFVNLGINFLTFDLRGHGRSEGFLYTLGIKEAEDISRIIDLILEMYPDHSFGIYAKGNSSNIALKALGQDKRIRYGIVENFFVEPVDQIEYLNYDDVLVSSSFIKDHIYGRALKYLDAKEADLEINYKNISQPLLMLCTVYNEDNIRILNNRIFSSDKVISKYIKNYTLLPSINGKDEGLVECISEFIKVHAEEAQEYTKEQVFQPSL